MNSYKKAGRIVGALFLIVMVSWSLGYWLIGDILNSPDYLDNVYASQIKIFFGILFELIEIAAIAGIVIMMFPMIRKYDERMAMGYVFLRILECVMLTIAIICSLSLITLSHEFINAGTHDTSYFQSLGTIFKSIRENWVHLILPFFYSLAGMIFFYFLYKSKLVPRFISIIGIIAATLVLIGIPFDFIEYKPGAFVGLLMGLTEIFLGLWLIIKGFNSSSIRSMSANKDMKEIQ